MIMSMAKSKKISVFISHSSEDKVLVESFVHNIIVLGLKIPEEKIFCTSIQGMKIKTGEDFVRKIKANLISSRLVFLIITENYKNSEICMNEMGAAWILEKPTLTLIHDQISYSEVGFLHITENIARINSPEDLDNLKVRVELELELNQVNADIWNKHKARFLSEITNLDGKNQKQVKPKISGMAAVSGRDRIPNSEKIDSDEKTLTPTEIKILKYIDDLPSRRSSKQGLYLIPDIKNTVVDICVDDLEEEYLRLVDDQYSLTEKAKRKIHKI